MMGCKQKFLLVWLLVSPCQAFVLGHVSENSLAASCSDYVGRRVGKTLPWKIRGGATETALNAKLADHSGAAQRLFGNMLGPAALLAGGLVPLGFLAPPLPTDKDRPFTKKLQLLYHILAVLSLSNELAAITYATIASNKLTELALEPSTSVFALIKRDFELAWVGTNVHFICGLFGFLSLVALRAFAFFPPKIKVATAGMAASALMMMLSVVNRGVAAGDGAGQVHGSNLVTLVIRYVSLLVSQTRNQFGVLSMASLVTAALSTGLAVRTLAASDGESS